MAKTLSNAQQQTLLLVLGVLSDLGLSETRPTQKAALAYCTTSLLEIVAPPNAPATAASSTAPPAATEGASKTEHPPAPPIRAYSHDAAVKAAATRKANKAKAAVTAKTDDAAGTVENDAAGSVQTE
jgi:hypothetical protein